MIKTVALVAALGASLAGAAHAGEYPEKPIRFILPNAPGGSPDTIARILAVRLTDILGQPFIIDNRPGAGGIIAVEAVAKATPDGYTLLQCGISQTISPALKRKLPYDTWNDLARIVQYGGVPNVLMVYTGLPARNLAELVDHARANPGRLKYGSSGIGFTPHLTMEMFRRAAGIELLHVPYKAAPQAVSDVIGGQIDLMFSNVPGATAQHPRGKSARRSGDHAAAQRAGAGHSDDRRIRLPGIRNDLLVRLVRAGQDAETGARAAGERALEGARRTRYPQALLRAGRRTAHDRGRAVRRVLQVGSRALVEGGAGGRDQARVIRSYFCVACASRVALSLVS